MLGGGLQNIADHYDDGGPEDSRSPADPVGDDTRGEEADELADEDGGGVEALRLGGEMKVVGVGGEDVEAVEHGSIVAVGGGLDHGAEHEKDGERLGVLRNPGGHPGAGDGLVHVCGSLGLAGGVQSVDAARGQG